MSDRTDIIIFDGPDGCAKSTMAKELASRFEISYFKYEGEWAAFEKDPTHFVNVMKYAEPYFLDYLRQSQVSVVIDRGYPSEWVYSQAFDRPTDMRALREVDKGFAALKTKIIIPFRKKYIADDRFDAITPEMLERIEDLYRDFIDWSECECMTLFVDDEDLEREMTEIFSFVQEK